MIELSLVEKIARRWTEMYYDWESGRAASPSATDLVDVGYAVMGKAILAGSPKANALVRRLWDEMCGGATLNALAQWFVNEVGEQGMGMR